MTWIVKVGDQYLAWHDHGNAGCSKKQRDALRFDDQGKAYRVAHKTFGLAEDDFDDDMGARVVKLVRRGITPVEYVDREELLRRYPQGATDVQSEGQKP
jgi:hypothetical protein